VLLLVLLKRTLLIFALSRSPFSRADPLCSYQQAPFPLSHFRLPTYDSPARQLVQYMRAVLTKRRQQSCRHLLCLYDQTNKALSLQRNVFLPSWLVIIQSVESLNFRQQEANYRVVAYSRTCRFICTLYSPLLSHSRSAQDVCFAI